MLGIWIFHHLLDRIPIFKVEFPFNLRLPAIRKFLVTNYIISYLSMMTHYREINVLAMGIPN